MATPDSQHQYRVPLGDKGRLVIPAALRKACGLKAGDRLVAKLEADGSIRLAKAASPVERARGMFAHLATDRSVVDELIQERREEARREEEA